ncbi:3-demethylubiquinone-9 3-methyltransferase [Chondromyces apiculatus DSM 436]|uniref:3-demethylubiquinone-9 3-methyltransferase n=2 Tax=Chondromyces apiculatus TaxID=51 RepID=A0A017TF22_9BACT|nr:3-demethylubiquinone-9 3-methyltransferase [Chondromyces apiculatus DSM 436]
MIDLEAEARNDRLAAEPREEDGYEGAPFLVRVTERRRLSIIREMTRPTAGLSVLEVGSGEGEVLRMFPDARLTALDVSLNVSNARREVARQKLTGFDARFVTGEVEALAGERFDRIICTEVLEHVADPEATLAAVARLLAPGGAAVFTVPNDPLMLRLWRVVRFTPLGWILGRRMWGGSEDPRLHAWTPRTFEDLLERHFRVVERHAAPMEALPIRACFRCLPRRR